MTTASNRLCQSGSATRTRDVRSAPGPSRGIMKRFVLSLFSAMVAATPAFAQGQAAAPSPSVDVGGLVDVYYDFYFTKTTGDAPFRNFDTKHDQFALSMAEVWFGKTPTADSRACFK